MKAGSVNYFAYGSNMHPHRLTERVGKLEPGVAARLTGYRIVFNKIGSKDRSAKANIEIGDADSGVWGVLWVLSETQFEEICKIEQGYKVLDVELRHESSPISGKTLIALNDFIDNSLKPLNWYMRFVIDGARISGLPKDHIASLQEIQAIND
jgi:hypothetical protein